MRLDYARIAILAALSLIAVASVGVTILLAYPYDPYAAEDARIQPLTVCPDEEVAIEVYSEVRADWTITRIEVFSEWVDVNDPSAPPIPAGEGTVLEPPPHPFEWTPSNVTRFASYKPGEFNLKTTARVYGTFDEDNAFEGFPKNQQVEYLSQDVVKVLNPTSPVCQAREGEG